MRPAPKETQAAAANFAFRLAEPAFQLPLKLDRHEAVKLLQARGFRARKTFDGLTEGRAPGLPLASGIDRR